MYGHFVINALSVRSRAVSKSFNDFTCFIFIIRVVSKYCGNGPVVLNTIYFVQLRNKIYFGYFAVMNFYQINLVEFNGVQNRLQKISLDFTNWRSKYTLYIYTYIRK